MDDLECFVELGCDVVEVFLICDELCFLIDEEDVVDEFECVW